MTIVFYHKVMYYKTENKNIIDQKYNSENNAVSFHTIESSALKVKKIRITFFNI